MIKKAHRFATVPFRPFGHGAKAAARGIDAVAPIAAAGGDMLLNAAAAPIEAAGSEAGSAVGRAAGHGLQGLAGMLGGAAPAAGTAAGGAVGGALGALGGPLAGITSGIGAGIGGGVGSAVAGGLNAAALAAPEVGAAVGRAAAMPAVKLATRIPVAAASTALSQAGNILGGVEDKGHAARKLPLLGSAMTPGGNAKQPAWGRPKGNMASVSPGGDAGSINDGSIRAAPGNLMHSSVMGDGVKPIPPPELVGPPRPGPDDVEVSHIGQTPPPPPGIRGSGAPPEMTVGPRLRTQLSEPRLDGAIQTHLRREREAQAPGVPEANNAMREAIDRLRTASSIDNEVRAGVTPGARLLSHLGAMQQEDGAIRTHRKRMAKRNIAANKQQMEDIVRKL